MASVIHNYLKQLEKKHQIIVLFASEVGSRNWGVPSPDSDYDIRFIFIHNDLKSYLKFKPEITTLDFEDGEFDLFGFELRYYLKLLQKCNPSVIEIIQSSQVYLNIEKTHELLLKLLSGLDIFKSLMYHYRNMITRHFKMYFTDIENPIPKKYFHIIRPALVIMYLQKTQQTDYPTNILQLLNQMIEPDNSVSKEIIDLAIAKKANNLKKPGQKRPLIEDWALKIVDDMKMPKIKNHHQITTPDFEEAFFSLLTKKLIPE